MQPLKRFQVSLFVATLLLSPLVCRADITVALTKGFVKKYKDQAPIPTTFRVDKHHNTPNPIGSGSEDGDVHIAGRDSVVKLPMVAEIINGKRENDTFKFLMQTTAGQAVPIVGVWRLWFEHPGSDDQIQGQTVPVPTNTNPDHIFEFHPVAQFGNFNCLDSFLPIADQSNEFRGYSADKAFGAYEQRPGTITETNTAIMITSNKAGYNYAEFEMRLTGNPKDVGDGYIVLANVYNAGAPANADPLTEEPRRMIFVKGSLPADKVATMKKGDKLHVLGIPRVNLNEVYAVASGLQGHEEYSEGGLPYEMIIVALLK
ncbi:MAG TPA: hypothetical protein DCK93_17510 [Blastocatellia bacterium]|nr:hypothetical protein [Blastocatellia bacterium]